MANTDNLFSSEKMRTLFIGEESGTHLTNYVWTYNVDGKKLTRLLNVPAAAEATGLDVVKNLGGHAYIISNNQHKSDWISSTPVALRASLETRAKAMFGSNHRGTVNYRLDAHVGSVAGLPGFQ